MDRFFIEDEESMLALSRQVILHAAHMSSITRRHLDGNAWIAPGWIIPNLDWLDEGQSLDQAVDRPRSFVYRIGM